MPSVSRKTFKNFSFIALLVSLIAVSGCGRQAAAPEPTPLAAPTAALPTPLPAADRVVLVAPADADPAIAGDAETLLRELAASSALEFEKREQIFGNEITPDMKVVVFLNMPENLGSLAAGAPSTQIVALTDQDWNPTPNVTVIRRRADHTAFLAGYLAALLAPNFRAGALLTAENPAASQAFINGVNYYCGVCAALIYPLNKYPLVSIQPAASPASTWQAGFNELNTGKVNVLYVANEAATPELLAYLAAQDVALIGGQTPPAEGLPKWTATIYSDGVTPIRDIWQDLLAGQGGKVINATLKIADNQYVSVAEGLVWLSQGKLNYAQKTIDLLRGDFINPLPVN